MDRRAVLLFAGSGALSLALGARAQPAKVRLGFLGAGNAKGFAPHIAGLRVGLSELRYVENKNLTLEFRWADGQLDKLPALARELLELKVAVLMTQGVPATRAAKEATTAVPIVMAAVGDPIVTGIVPSLSRPGGNITGLTFFSSEVSAKRLELLRDTLPQAKRVGVLFNPDNPIQRGPLHEAVLGAAASLKLAVDMVDARSATEFDKAFSRMAGMRCDAVMFIDDPLQIVNARALVDGAVKLGLVPAGGVEFASAGAVLGYGVSFPDLYRRSAVFVDKILKGARPSDMPIERATRFELVLNAATAKRLRIEIPKTVEFRADRILFELTLVQQFGSFDYVIVGAGSAGCLLANRLSRNPENRVLLLEAGGKDDYFWIPIPVGYLYTIANPRTDWCYKTEADEHLAGRSIHYARGLGLGGCSSINAMIHMRGQKEDWDYWASLGNRGWSWDEVLPVFKALEDYEHGAVDTYGAGGEVRVEDPRVRWDILDAFRDAAAQCGIPKVKVFNTGDNFGSAYFQMNQRRGRRWSATNAFLRPALRRPNLAVVTGALVSSIRFSGREALGVEFSINNEKHFVQAQRETLLCAGAIGSPQLLQLSGIGNETLLGDKGIAVRHHLPGVGENLHDHLQIRLQYKVRNAKTLNGIANAWWGKAAMAAEYLLFRTGPLTMPPSQVGAFAKSDPAQPTPNIEWHVQPLSLDKFGDPLHSFPAITPSVCNLRPASRGFVRIRTPDPRAHPEIRLNYLKEEADRRVAVDAMRFTRRIMAAPALAPYQPEEYRPGASITNDDELTRAAGELGTTIFHPVGTCRMGNDPMAVVDGELRVHGLGRLRVVDASVFPRITSGNTNAPTYVVAEKGARAILKP